MVDKVRFYPNRGQRKQIIREENKLGFFVKHDDFIDSNDRPTDGKSGRLTLTDTRDIVAKTRLKKQEVQDLIIEQFAKQNNIEITN